MQETKSHQLAVTATRCKVGTRSQEGTSLFVFLFLFLPFVTETEEGMLARHERPRSGLALTTGFTQRETVMRFLPWGMLNWLQEELDANGGEGLG